MTKVTKILKRATTTLIAALMLTTVLSACGQSGKPETDPSKSESEKAVPLRVWAFLDTTTNTEVVRQLSESVTKLTKDSIGVEVEITGSGDYEKLNLALTSGETLDLVATHAYSPGLSSMVNIGYAQPIDDLLKEYGKDILDIVPDAYMKAGQVNGVQYATPNMKDTAGGAGFSMRSEVLNELKIDPESIKTWDDVHDVLVQVKDKYPDLYPLVPTWQNGGMHTVIPYDSLTPSKLGVLENVFEDSTDVVCLYETDSYREFCERMYQWNQEGLIMPDATTNTEYTLLGSVGFAEYENTKPGKLEELKKVQGGLECELIPMMDPYTTTGSVSGDMWIIPTSSKNPEKAMQLLNMMYSNADLSTTLINGVEDVHWVWANEEHTVITYPEGVDAANASYQVSDWAWPNCRITPVWEGVELDHWDQLQQFCDGARVSPAMGFVFDTTKVMNQITACGNVVSEYDTALRWGELNPDEALPQFIEKLKASGVDDVVQECQRQLDAYLAADKS